MNLRCAVFIIASAVMAAGGRVDVARAAGYSVRVGDILVANYEGFSVVKIDRETRAQEHLGNFILPTDLALDSSGRLFISEVEGSIQQLDLGTGMVTPVLDAGSGPGSIFGIALGPDGELYVTSGDDDAVYRVDPDTRIATLLSAKENLVGVNGIDLLDSRHLVVSCSSAAVSRLVSVALDGGAQTVLASGGELDEPRGVAVQGTDVFTTSYDSKRLLRLSGGVVETVAHTPGFPYGIGIGPDGDIVVGSKGTADEVRVYAPDGTLLDSFSGGFIALAAGIDVSRIQVNPSTELTVFLEAAASLGTGFDGVPATIDFPQRTIEAGRRPGQRFFRLRSSFATRITQIQVTGERVIIRWE